MFVCGPPIARRPSIAPDFVDQPGDCLVDPRRHFVHVSRLLVAHGRDQLGAIIAPNAGRFAAGPSLGAIMPNAMALAGEYSPRGVRASRMMIVSCGYALGPAACGMTRITLGLVFPGGPL